MLKILGVRALIVGMLAAAPAWACRDNSQVPPHGESASHEVLAVEVTGVRLTSYQWYRAATLKLQPWPESPNGEQWLYPTSSTPGFRVNVLVHDSTARSGELFRELSLGGCGVRVPTLKELGLLFLGPDGSVGVVWEDNGAEYRRWLTELGLRASAEP